MKSISSIFLFFHFPSLIIICFRSFFILQNCRIPRNFSDHFVEFPEIFRAILSNPPKFFRPFYRIPPKFFRPFYRIPRNFSDHFIESPEIFRAILSNPPKFFEPFYQIPRNFLLIPLSPFPSLPGILCHFKWHKCI